MDTQPTGVEARVCQDIAARQRVGMAKYGVTLEQSPDDTLRHAYEEALDLAVYLRAEWERRQWQPIITAKNGLRPILVTDGHSAWVDQKIGIQWDEEPGEYYFNGHEKWEEVTHWLPLPAPPDAR